jgi:hypothetical protein
VSGKVGAPTILPSAPQQAAAAAAAESAVYRWEAAAAEVQSIIAAAAPDVAFAYGRTSGRSLQGDSPAALLSHASKHQVRPRTMACFGHLVSVTELENM